LCGGTLRQASISPLNLHSQSSSHSPSHNSHNNPHILFTLIRIINFKLNLHLVCCYPHVPFKIVLTFSLILSRCVIAVTLTSTLIFEVRCIATVSVSRHYSVGYKTLDEYEEFGGLIIDRVTRRTRRNLISATLSTTNPTPPDLKPQTKAVAEQSHLTSFTMASHRVYCYPDIYNPQTDAICIVSILMVSLNSELNKTRNILASRLSLSSYTIFHIHLNIFFIVFPHIPLTHLHFYHNLHLTFILTSPMTLQNLAFY
jgi:hypothetical protein